MLKNIIIIDDNCSTKGGTAQVAVSSAIELSIRGYKVTYIAADNSEGHLLEKNGIKVINLNQHDLIQDPSKIRAAINGIWNYSTYRSIKAILGLFDTHNTIIHIHGYVHRLSPSILKACSESEIKSILTLHDYFILCPCGGFYNYKNNSICHLQPFSLKCVISNCDKRNYIQKLWRNFRQVLINMYLRYNDKISLIYISNFSYSKMRKYLYKNHRTYYVKNPYDIGKEIKYNPSKNSNYVYLGRLSAEKGVELFCKAFSELQSNKLIDKNAIIVGDGELKDSLEKQYPNISFLGWIPHENIEEIISLSRVLVFPSKWYEGSPLTPIEFMAHGIPCITSDACAATEYINNNVNGMIFRSENIEDLKKKILYLNDDSNLSKISSCLNSSFNRKDYSVESHVDNLIKVYDLELSINH